MSPLMTGLDQTSEPSVSFTAYSVPPLPAPPVYTRPFAAVGGDVKIRWLGSWSDQRRVPLASSKASIRPVKLTVKTRPLS